MSRHYIISDLHLGMGKKSHNSWHPLEDFKADEYFRKLLDLIEEERGDELIINGDWIDFLQLEPFDSYKSNLFSASGQRLGWTEDDSLNKLENCKASNAHKGFFDDLRALLKTGKKVTVIMGNHDPDLFWPKIQQEIYQLVEPPRAEQLVFHNTHIKRGTAHIEHGNQHCSPENKFRDPNNIFHICQNDGLLRLEMIWGSLFVMEFLNGIETEYPFADNIKPESLLLWLGIKNGWIGGTEAAKFIKFLLGAGIPWNSVVSNVLSENADPEDLIKKIYDQNIACEILERFSDDKSFKEAFELEINKTVATEWQSIFSNNPQEYSLEDIESLYNKTSDTLNLFRDSPEFRGVKELLKQQGVKQVIFGHTHMEIDGSKEDAKVRNYFNTGSWVNSLDISKKENKQRLNGLSKEDLNDESLFDLRLMYALVDVKDSNTSVSLNTLAL